MANGIYSTCADSAVLRITALKAQQRNAGVACQRDMHTPTVSCTRPTGPEVHPEAQLELRDRLQVGPCGAGYYFRERGVVDADEFSRLAEAAVANGGFHVPRELSRHLVNRIYCGHVRPIGNALARVRPMGPWHTTSVDEQDRRRA